MSTNKSDKMVTYFTSILIITALILLASKDLYVLKLLADYSDEPFTKFMSESIFQGQNIGMGDIPIFVNMLLVVLACLGGWVKRLPKRVFYLSRYCFISNVFFGVFVVHGLKKVIGRARPYVVLEDPDRYSSFLEFGRFWPMVDKFSGSMPSGHTAAMVSLLPVVLCFVRPARPRVIAMTAVLLLALLMSIARVMSLDHFITDCLVVILLGWNFHMFTYHVFFKVPRYELDDDAHLGYLKVFQLAVICCLIPASLYLLRLAF